MVRCALEGFAALDQRPTAQDVLAMIMAKIPPSSQEEAAAFQVRGIIHSRLLSILVS